MNISKDINTGNSHEFRNVQTLDLMASKDFEISQQFCQANIIEIWK